MKYIIDLPDGKPIAFLDEEHMNTIVPDKNEMYVFDGAIGTTVVKLTPYDPDEVEKARKAGQDEVWEAARIITGDDDDCLEYQELLQIFLTDDYDSIIKEKTAQEVLLLLDKYRKENKIHIGDEVAFHHDDRQGAVVVVTHIGDDGYIDGMDARGILFASKNPKLWTKTGRHFDLVEKLLQEMKGEQE